MQIGHFGCNCNGVAPFTDRLQIILLLVHIEGNPSAAFRTIAQPPSVQKCSKLCNCVQNNTWQVLPLLVRQWVTALSKQWTTMALRSPALRNTNINTISNQIQIQIAKQMEKCKKIRHRIFTATITLSILSIFKSICALPWRNCSHFSE